MKKKLPTKEEVKAARALRKQGLTILKQANVVLSKIRRPLRRHRRGRLLTPAETEFRTWRHDMRVLMPALLRTSNFDSWTPVELACHAAVAADKMKDEVALRRPENTMERGFRGEDSQWGEWQDFFDQCVHHLAERSDMDALTVISRSTALADAAIKVIKKRRAKLGKT